MENAYFLSPSPGIPKLRAHDRRTEYLQLFGITGSIRIARQSASQDLENGAAMRLKKQGEVLNLYAGEIRGVKKIKYIKL